MTRFRKIMLAVLLLGGLGGVFLFSSSCSKVTGNQNPDRPNIILIITDDQPIHTLDYMPILQKELIGRGINFTNGYVTTPLCCPSRASILTGLFAHNTGVLTNRPPDGGVTAFNDKSTLAVWMKQAGYHTGLIGKYLNNTDSLPKEYVAPGWDNWEIFWDRDKTVDFSPSLYYGYLLNENGKLVQYGKEPEAYSTDVLTQKALNFIDSSGEQPFFLWLGYYGPHDPFKGAVRHDKLFRTNADWTPYYPPNFIEADLSDKPAWLQSMKRVTADQAFDVDQGILRAILSVDDGLGKIVAQLDNLGIRDNTILIFMSDNGQAIGENGIIGKNCAYEACIKVPFIFSYPGLVKTPRVDDHFILNIDLAPTLAELAHVTIPYPPDGVSFSSILTDPQAKWRESFFFEHFQETTAEGAGGLSALIPSFNGLRTREWKYVEYADGFKELYDLINDPYELQNLGTLPEYQKTIVDLAEKLKLFK